MGSLEEQIDALMEKSYPKWVKRHIEIPKISVYSVLDDIAKKYPERIAIDFFSKKLNYSELRKYVDTVAGSLRKMGVTKGDRVSIMLPNVPHYVIFFFAVLKLGGTVVQTNPLYTTHELESQISDSGSSVIIVLDDFINKVIPLHPSLVQKVIVAKVEDFLPSPLAFLYSASRSAKRTKIKIPKEPWIYSFRDILSSESSVGEETISPETHPALLQYTGGTTGVPKAALLTHYNLIANAYQIREWIPEDYRSGISYLSAIPFFHVYGMMTAMLVPVLQGSRIILVPDPRDTKMILKAMHKMHPQAFPGIPSMYHSILNYRDVGKYDIKSVKFCMSGASPLPEELQKNFETATNGMIIEGYGLSETSPVANINPMDVTMRKIGSIGLPVSNTYEKIVDIETGTKDLGPGEVGELVIRGPQVMSGYWNNKDETTIALRDGWLYTGDIAKMDEDGFFYIVDRKKDMIIAGGYNIYPQEVEEILYKHPKVSEAAVIGVNDPHRGETVKAYIVLKKGETATPEEIIEFCRQYLAKYKIPKIIEFVEELPKSLVGKVLKRELRSRKP
jgi:long-chain acyl-CoA synthetase